MFANLNAYGIVSSKSILTIFRSIYHKCVRNDIFTYNRRSDSTSVSPDVLSIALSSAKLFNDTFIVGIDGDESFSVFFCIPLQEDLIQLFFDLGGKALVLFF